MARKKKGKSNTILTIVIVVIAIGVVGNIFDSSDSESNIETTTVEVIETVNSGGSFSRSSLIEQETDTETEPATIEVTTEPITEPPTTTQPPTEPPTTVEPTTEKSTEPKTEKSKVFIVYWGNTGDKVHIKPDCRTIKNGVLSGTLEECKAAGHTEGWCGVCSPNWSDEQFLKNGNPYAK